MIVGIIVALLSTALWLGPELICEHIAGTQHYLFWSHGVWHVGMSYALITIAQCVIFIHLYANDPQLRHDFGDNVRRTTFEDDNILKGTCIEKIFFFIFLIIQPQNQKFKVKKLRQIHGHYVVHKVYQKPNVEKKKDKTSDVEEGTFDLKYEEEQEVMDKTHDPNNNDY